MIVKLIRPTIIGSCCCDQHDLFRSLVKTIMGERGYSLLFTVCKFARKFTFFFPCCDRVTIHNMERPYGKSLCLVFFVLVCKNVLFILHACMHRIASVHATTFYMMDDESIMRYSMQHITTWNLSIVQKQYAIDTTNVISMALHID